MIIVAKRIRLSFSSEFVTKKKTLLIFPYRYTECQQVSPFGCSRQVRKSSYQFRNPLSEALEEIHILKLECRLEHREMHFGGDVRYSGKQMMSWFCEPTTLRFGFSIALLDPPVNGNRDRKVRWIRLKRHGTVSIEMLILVKFVDKSAIDLSLEHTVNLSPLFRRHIVG